MLFNSGEYLAFLLFVGVLHYLLPPKYRWWLLLGASYHFYMSWNVAYAILIATVTLSAYVAGRAIGSTESARARTGWLVANLCICFGILFVYKYLDFSLASVNAITGLLGDSWEMSLYGLLLPVGISFFTFQAASYVIDIYRGEQKPEGHLGYLALYISFFPQLVAGPIERASKLLPQIASGRAATSYDQVVSGLRLILIGLFKKIVIADNIATVVDRVYSDVDGHTGVHYVIATVLFAYQIYCDFSGYCDIAVGSARILGYDLTVNFNRPYAARSFSDFWRRWNITLSTWFRDYVYISLGGNRVTVSFWLFNLMFVFLVSGLWHGAQWTFVLWGGLNGLYLVAEATTKKWRRAFCKRWGIEREAPLYTASAVLFTFTFINLGWVFFRAESLSDAWYIVTRLYVGMRGFFYNLFGLYGLDYGWSYYVPGVTGIQLMTILGGIALIELMSWKEGSKRVENIFIPMSRPVRWGLYYTMMVTILLFGQLGKEEFIYFQF